MKTLNCAIKAVFFFTVALLFSASANAQDIGAIDARIGIDTGDSTIYSDSATFALGEDVRLDGCFSRFLNVGASSGASLCWPDPFGDSTYATQSNIDWTLVNDATSASTTFGGTEIPLTTGGASDFINAVGSYTLTLVVTGLFGEFVSLSPVGHYGIQPGGGFGTATATITVTSGDGPFAVPEPSAVLLLFPALMMIGRRQRRKSIARAA